MDIETVFKILKKVSNPKAVQGMAKFAISADKNLGVRIPDLRRLGKEIGRDRDLAGRLWAEQYRETMILAGLVDDPAQVDDEQMEAWVKDFFDWEICDQTIMNLFEKTDLADVKAVEWSDRPEEFVKRAGFVLMARKAVSDKKAPDEAFDEFLSLIIREAGDNRPMVKKAVNWALRQIGKRNLSLNKKAVETARQVQKMDSPAARWVAADALRELTGEAVQERLRKRHS